MEWRVRIRKQCTIREVFRSLARCDRHAHFRSSTGGPGQSSIPNPSPQPGYRRPSATSSTLEEPQAIRILEPRSRPQCWEHGCNGRQFSTFSNLLRHQREKSGTATKSYCPRCGAEFTRTTARNGHLAHDKCTKRSTDDQ